ncbi:MAG: hypothetical protein ACTSWF_04075 [Candidatus Freyarchaeota archaeon]
MPFFCRVCGKQVKGIGNEAKHICEWALEFTRGKSHWRYKKHYDFLVRNHCPFEYEEVKKLLDELDSKTSAEKSCNKKVEKTE